MRRVGDNKVAGTGVDELMRVALEETRSTYPHPNPRVGAVLTSSDGTVLSVAAHSVAGQPHAEVLALSGIEDPSGTTMYVTLEPCNHHGRTPPCTEAIIDAGVAEVFVGANDPDQRVAGSGIQRLKAEGIKVTTGVIADEIISSDPAYFHHRRTGVPLVTLKLAATLDGQVGAADGTSMWISSTEAREDAHLLRAESDVVIVGSGTVIADDPMLDVRIGGYEGPQPRPVIVAGARSLPTDRRVLARDPIIYRSDVPGPIDPVFVVKDLGARNYLGALVEGGPGIAASFLNAGLVDRIVWYAAAKLAVGRGTPAVAGVFETMDDITDLTIIDVAKVGPDIRISATISKER